MVALVICLTGYALALPFAQDNRGRRQNNRTQRSANNAPARNANTPQNNTPQRDVERPDLPDGSLPEDTTLVIDNEDAHLARTTHHTHHFWRPVAECHGPETPRQHEARGGI